MACAPASAASERCALVVFIAPGALPHPAMQADAVQAELTSVGQLSVGILSATQGSYSAAQMLLDITQGARVSPSAYAQAQAPSLALAADGQVKPWALAVKRAQGAPQLLQPGLLAESVPGGGAYVGVDAVGRLDGVLAADRSGRVAAVSLGSPATLLSRVNRARATGHRLIVADLPAGEAGRADLIALAAQRPAEELLVVLPRIAVQANGLSWAGVAGLGAGGRTLTSQTTNERGLIAAVDLGPTILTHLGLSVPADMRGEPLRLDGALDARRLRSLEARLGVVAGRRLPALGWLGIAWALLLGGARMSGSRQTHRAREAWALRVGALALLWAPVGTLIAAALQPGRTAEFALLALSCLALGALSDRLIGWPRAPIAPAAVAVAAIVVDALAGSQLLMRSLLGPNPAFGARFYGIGNELKSGLAALVLCAAAAALYPAIRGRRSALTLIGAGATLAAVEGSARIGAGVGGVILVCAGTAVAGAMALPGALTRRRLVAVTIAPAVGLAALAALDLASAHGSGHFTGSVLHARSAGDVRDILVRRYGAAWDELRNHLMPLATALALAGGAVGVARRQRLTAPVGGDPAWIAALCGGLAAGALGALTEDSGPVLLVVAVGTLGCVLAYLWGRPPARNLGAAKTPNSRPARPLHSAARQASGADR